MLSLTSQQQAIIEAVKSGQDNMLVDAVAGSGKTTTLVQACQLGIPQSTKATALAFNKRNAEDMGRKMPRHVPCKTTHSLGLAAWKQYMQMSGRQLDVQTKKGYALLEDVKIGRKKFGDLLRLVSLAKSAGLVPMNAQGGEGLVPDTFEMWQDLVDTYDLQFPIDIPNPIELARDMLSISIKRAKRGEIDFDDMLYMPACFAETQHFPECEFLLVDEAQDIAAIQRAMFMKIAPQRFMCVGDRHQAIYGFRGADYHSLDRLGQLFNCTELPMTLSFRCPKLVIAEAQRYVPHIEAALDREGEVKELDQWDFSDIKTGDAMICRNNKPLVQAAFYLIKNQVPAKILGREIGQGLVKMVRDAKGATIQDRLASVLENASKKIYDLENRGKDEAAARVIDQRECIISIAENLPSMNAPAEILAAAIENLFSDESAPVTLATVHKAKGLEWSRVWFLDSHLIPSRYATTDDQVQQEMNIAYVAVTRAMESLFYIKSHVQQ
jgi:DNA helicase-2/ATP-dependent DNA helicase PcrA